MIYIQFRDISIFKTCKAANEKAFFRWIHHAKGHIRILILIVAEKKQPQAREENSIKTWNEIDLIKWSFFELIIYSVKNPSRHFCLWQKIPLRRPFLILLLTCQIFISLLCKFLFFPFYFIVTNLETWKRIWISKEYLVVVYIILGLSWELKIQKIVRKSFHFTERSRNLVLWFL